MRLLHEKKCAAKSKFYFMENIDFKRKTEMLEIGKKTPFWSILGSDQRG